MTLTLRACVTQISADAFKFAHVNPNFTVCYLPIMFARGKPTSLEKISEEELEAFVPFMILCSFNHPDNSNGLTLTVNRGIQNVFSGPKPPWWFKDLPFQYPVQISGMWRNKFAVLKSLVCRCYTFYNCEYILRICAELAEECPEDLHYRHDDENMLSMFNDGTFLIKFWKENMLYDAVVQPEVYALSSSDSENDFNSGNAGCPANSNVYRSSHKLENPKMCTHESETGNSVVGGSQSPKMAPGTAYFESRKPSVCSSTYSSRVPQNPKMEVSSNALTNYKDGIHQNQKSLRRVRRRSAMKTVQESDSSDSEPSTSFTHSSKRRRKAPSTSKQSIAKSNRNRPSRLAENSVVQQQPESRCFLPVQQIPSNSNCQSDVSAESFSGGGQRSRQSLCIESSDPLNQDEFVFHLRLLPRSHKKTSPKKTKVLSPVPKDSRRENFAKRAQLQIFQNVPLSSDLGRKYLERVKPFICTDYHIDKIERYINGDNHASSVFRRSDVASSTSGTLDVSFPSSSASIIEIDSSSSSSADEHDPQASTRCSSRYFKFPKCKTCKKNKHKNMRKCSCLSGSAESKINYCYVHLNVLPQEKLESLQSSKPVEHFRNVETTTKLHKSNPTVVAFKKEIEIIDLTDETEDKEEVDNNEVAIVKCVVNKTTPSLKNDLDGTSSSRVVFSKKNNNHGSEGNLNYLDSDSQRRSKTDSRDTDSNSISSLPTSKENHFGRMGFNSLMLGRSHESSNKNFRDTSSNHVILSKEHNISSEKKYSHGANLDIERIKLGPSSSKNDSLNASNPVHSIADKRSSSKAYYRYNKLIILDEHKHKFQETPLGNNLSESNPLEVELRGLNSFGLGSGNLGDQMKTDFHPVTTNKIEVHSEQNVINNPFPISLNGGHDLEGANYFGGTDFLNNEDHHGEMVSPLYNHIHEISDNEVHVGRCMESAEMSSTFSETMKKKPKTRSKAKMNKAILTEQAYNRRLRSRTPKKNEGKNTVANSLNQNGSVDNDTFIETLVKNLQSGPNKFSNFRRNISPYLPDGLL